MIITLFTIFSNIFNLVLLGVFVWRSFWRKYPVFFSYYLYTSLFGFLNLYLTQVKGLTLQTVWYSNMYYIYELTTHLLKIAVIISLYHLVLAAFPHFRAMIDIVFYLITITLLFIVAFRFNPEQTFIYTAGIFIGKWAFLMVAVICALILALVGLGGIKLDKPFMFIVLGFMVYSLIQCLNYFYLGVFYQNLAQFWRWCYAISYLFARLLWLGAAILPEPVPAPAGAAPPGGQSLVYAQLKQLDDLAALILQRLSPWGGKKQIFLIL